MYKSVNELDEIKWENSPVNLSTEAVLTRNAHRFGIKRELLNRETATISLNKFYNRLAPT